MSFVHWLSHLFGLNSECYCTDWTEDNSYVFRYIRCNKCGKRYDFEIERIYSIDETLSHPYR